MQRRLRSRQLTPRDDTREILGTMLPPSFKPRLLFLRLHDLENDDYQREIKITLKDGAIPRSLPRVPEGCYVQRIHLQE